jgi:hypothetical protein
MGVFYDGPYADDVNHDAFHEGYAARLMPDGTLSSAWGGLDGLTGHTGLVGACDCGWRADLVHPPGDYASPSYEAAEEDFRTQHLQPLIEAARQQSWPRWTTHVTGLAAQVADHAQRGRLDDAEDLLRELRQTLDRRIPVLAELRAEHEYAQDRQGDASRAFASPVTNPVDQPLPPPTPAPVTPTGRHAR